MSDLDKQGRRLLSLLVQQLRTAISNRPETFIAYKEVHVRLGLEQRGPTYGESLKHQGLSNLANWTASEGHPGITGLIIDSTSNMPGSGYFRLYKKADTDFAWWANQIRRSKEFDWSDYLDDVLPDSPKAADIEPPGREQVVSYRVRRDTKIAKRVKALHGYSCQICGNTIELPDDSKYAEAHHIRPLGGDHGGTDEPGNIICLCPNHHAEVDLGTRPLRLNELRKATGHTVDASYLRYHNEVIYKGQGEK